MNDQAIENAIKAKGLTAPRITPEDIEANIVGEHYFTAASAAGLPPIEGIDFVPPRPMSPLDLLTFCILVLRNGFTVTGESACASPENFDAEIGRKIARANAVNKVWPLMGYELRSKLASGENAIAQIARKFLDDNHVSCEEASTNDRVYENAPDLVCELGKAIGFYKYPTDAEEGSAA